MANKTKAKTDSGTLGDIAESLRSLLDNAEKQWRAWQGPRDAVVKAVTDVRDRAATLLSEIGAAADAATGRRTKKGKKKDKKKKHKAKRAKAEKAKAAKAKNTTPIKADKADKNNLKDEKKARGKTGAKKRTKATRPATAAPLPAATPAADLTGPDAGDTAEP